MHPGSAPRLIARDLALWRGDRLLVEGLGFELGPGEVLLLRGPNGAGKTSLLRCLAGLAPVERGEVAWRGERIDRSAAYREELAWVGHLAGLKRGLTARENLDAEATLRGRMPDPTRVAEALRGAGLDALADRPVERLSAGQRRRAALARLALADARLWLLDEPQAHLDAAGFGWFEAGLAKHLAAGGLAVIATHQTLAPASARVTDIELEAAA